MSTFNLPDVKTQSTALASPNATVTTVTSIHLNDLPQAQVVGIRQTQKGNQLVTISYGHINGITPDHFLATPARLPKDFYHVIEEHLGEDARLYGYEEDIPEHKLTYACRVLSNSVGDVRLQWIGQSNRNKHVIVEMPIPVTPGKDITTNITIQNRPYRLTSKGLVFEADISHLIDSDVITPGVDDYEVECRYAVLNAIERFLLLGSSKNVTYIDTETGSLISKGDMLTKINALASGNLLREKKKRQALIDAYEILIRENCKKIDAIEWHLSLNGDEYFEVRDGVFHR